jgi:hypothetical protein
MMINSRAKSSDFKINSKNYYIFLFIKDKKFEYLWNWDFANHVIAAKPQYKRKENFTRFSQISKSNFMTMVLNCIFDWTHNSIYEQINIIHIWVIFLRHNLDIIFYQLFIYICSSFYQINYVLILNIRTLNQIKWQNKEIIMLI